MEKSDRHPHPTYPKLYVFKQPRSRFYNVEMCIQGRKTRKSLKTDRLATAFVLAADEWKAHQRATLAEDKKRKFDRLSSDPTIGELFVSWRKTLPPLKRPYHDTKWGAVGPFWRAVLVTEVTPQLFRDYFLQRRRESTQYDKPPTNSTLKKDTILLRLILKHAVEHGHLPQLPTIPSPGEIVANPRPWLTRQEWEHLKQVSANRIEEVGKNLRLLEQRIDLDDQIMFMVATMMRVGEMQALRYRDCRIEKNAQKAEILICEVQGKRGIRTVVGRSGAAEIVERRKKQAEIKDASALVFPVHRRDAFTALLKAAKLHTDNHGFTRNMKSLRATAISLRILDSEMPNLLLIARNAGTSLTMIDAFYASRLSAEHGKDFLTAKRKNREDE